MELLLDSQVNGEVIDHLGLIAATIDTLDLIKKVDIRLPVSSNKGSKVSMGQRLSAMILNGLGFIDDRLYMFPDFLSNKPIERLLGDGLSAEHFNDDALGRALDAIYDYGSTKLFTEIAFEIGIENNLLGRSAHFDTSTISVYGDYDTSFEEEKIVGVEDNIEKKAINITQGYAKNHRFDLKQMVINLATSGASGFPVWMEAHNGNASDKRIMIDAAKRMKDFCKDLKAAPDFLYVGDSALYENCVKEAVDMKWLSRVPETSKEAKILVSRKDQDFTWSEQGNGYRITPIESNYGGIKQRWILVYSEQAYKRESMTLDKNILREKTSLEKTLWHLSKQEFDCEHDAMKAAHLCMKKIKFHRVTFSTLSTKKYDVKGRPAKDSENFTLSYSVNGLIFEDEIKNANHRIRKGRFILATNELDKKKLPDEEILPEYKGQSKTESGFRFIKNNAFEVSSIFLKKPQRVEALMMVMTLCLMVYSVAQHNLREALKKSGETIPNQLKKEIQNPTMLWVCRLFQGVQLLHIQFQSVTQELVINLKELTKRIVRYFGKRAEFIYGLSYG